MQQSIPPAFWKTFARLRWVSLGCLMAFSLERFIYHVFDVGTLYHQSPTTPIWLMLLPLLGYAIVLFRSPILFGQSRPLRVIALSIASILLAVGFLFASLVLFTSIVFSRIQWW
jgi:hypothetical protein